MTFAFLDDIYKYKSLIRIRIFRINRLIGLDKIKKILIQKKKNKKIININKYEKIQFFSV